MGRIMIIFNLVSFFVVIITILARDHHKQPASFVFKDFQNFSGFGTAYASLLGILQSAFGMTVRNTLMILSANDILNLTRDMMPLHT